MKRILGLLLPLLLLPSLLAGPSPARLDAAGQGPRRHGGRSHRSPRQGRFPGRGEPLRRRHEGRGAAGEARRDLDGGAKSDGRLQAPGRCPHREAGGIRRRLRDRRAREGHGRLQGGRRHRRPDRRILHRPAPAARGCGGRSRLHPSRRLCPQGCVSRARGDDRCRRHRRMGPAGNPFGAGGSGALPGGGAGPRLGAERPRRDGGGEQTLPRRGLASRGVAVLRYEKRTRSTAPGSPR